MCEATRFFPSQTNSINRLILFWEGTPQRVELAKNIPSRAAKPENAIYCFCFLWFKRFAGKN
jgi:hypothetical protein